VRRCNVDGNPIIGVALTSENVRNLTRTLPLPPPLYPHPNPNPNPIPNPCPKQVRNLTKRLERMAGGDAETIKAATRQVRHLGITPRPRARCVT
jgi:hypothetical protein